MMKQCGCSKNLVCGCCAGVAALTPQPTANRPGLNQVRYRVGTHAAFYDAMRARLANFRFEDSDAKTDSPNNNYPLKDLKTRLPDDPAIAMLSAAAVMLDVLTFYQERIANEGFLRTATERRSVLELGRLVGYTPRPGVAASVYFAYTLDDKSEPVEIPAGARAQSVPLPDELPQSFETAEKLRARREFNNLQPRMSQPQVITFANILTYETLYFEGTDTKLKTNDPLLFAFEDKKSSGEKLTLRRVQTVAPQFDANRTQVTLQKIPRAALDASDLTIELLAALDDVPSNSDFIELLRETADRVNQNIRLGFYPHNAESKDVSELIDNLKSAIKILEEEAPEELKIILEKFKSLKDNAISPIKIKPEPANFNQLVESLLAAPSQQPANSLRFGNSVKKVFAPNSGIRSRLLVNFQPGLADTLYPALANAAVSVVQPELTAVYALRVTAPLFGYNAPKILFARTKEGLVEPIEPKDPDIVNKSQNQMFLDNAYEKIAAGDENKSSYIVVNRSNRATTEAFQIVEAQIRPLTDYGLSSKTTALTLDGDWWKPFSEKNEPHDTFDTIRQTIVYAQSERLALVEQPKIDDIGGGEIELGALYEGLEAGRWIIVSGERADLPGVSGIMTSELAMLAGVRQKTGAGGKYHTTLLLAGQNNDGKAGLQYRYRRGTVKIYGNVVKATHGETRNEVLGSGNAAQWMQTFALKQPPLTFVSAPTASGIESTLRVRVNDVEWRETDSLAELKPQDRKFITKTDDEAKTSVVFGSGEQGARLPTGIENVRAVYRSGIGKAGNVKAGQISLLMTKPLGVREVINPLRASGGADEETRDQARGNVPVALMALDRLVSTKDYADFARTFAGIGKSSVARLSDGYRQIVHLTIAGADDIPVDVNSDLFRNLRLALAKNGDAFQPIQIAPRELLALVIAASVAIRADYQWEKVAVKIRAALLNNFSFERRELGQSVFLSEVVSVIQSVEGVAYSDVDVLDGIAESELGKANFLKGKLKSWQEAGKPNQFVRAHLARANLKYKSKANAPRDYILPAQLAYLAPDVPDTLILNQIEEVKK